MFQLGDTVIYSSHGPCRITGIEEKNITGKRLTYYILEPRNGAPMRFYVPRDLPKAQEKLRELITPDGLESLLSQAETHEIPWNNDENRRKQWYKDLLTSGDRQGILGALVCIHRHKQQLHPTGRKLHMCDSHFLREAEKLLEEEISLVLGIPVENVNRYLKERLDRE